jgi:hypothetical protein
LLFATTAWVLLIESLFIAPVWDEQGFVRIVFRLREDMLNLFAAVWFEHQPYRPIAKTLLISVVSLTETEEQAWQALRITNVILILSAAGFLLLFLRNTIRLSPLILGGVWVLILFSPAALVTASWGANIFDATALLALTFGLWSLSNERFVRAAVSFGMGFFCKETAVLILPFMAYWLMTHRISAKEVARSASIVGGLLLVYFVLRSRVIEFGSEADIHGFDWARFPEFFNNYVNTMWFQVAQAPPYIGWTVLLVFLLILNDLRAVLGVVLLITSCGVIYLGMPHRGDAIPAIAHTVFQPRLYLIPSVLVLSILLAHVKPRFLVILLLSPLTAMGMAVEYHYYASFQRTYANIEQLSAREGRKIVIQADRPGIQNAMWRDGKIAYEIRQPGATTAEPDFVLEGATGIVREYDESTDEVPRVSIAVESKRPAAESKDGAIKVAYLKGPQIVFVGWTPLPASDEGKKMWLVLPEELQPIRHKVSVRARPDVAEKLKRPDLARSGFQLVLTFDTDAKTEAAAEAICVFVSSEQVPLTQLRGTHSACH